MNQPLDLIKRLWLAGGICGVILIILIAVGSLQGTDTLIVQAREKSESNFSHTNHLASGGSQVFLPVILKSKSSQIQYRPYSNDSIWNTPIGPSPQYDPHSAEMIATIGLNGDGEIYSDPSQYTFPVYVVDKTSPRWTVDCIEYKCLIVTPNGTDSARQLRDVPIPHNARSSSGHDAQMIIVDEASNAEYDFWHVEKTESGWKVGNGSVYNILWDGMPTRYNSRGAGVPYFAGLIRPWEIRKGQIEHAIAFGYPEPAHAQCVFPASKTDGDSTLTYAIPEGARLQLDPSLTDADFDSMGLDGTGKIIARALQEYGMFLIDSAGVPKVYVEDLENNPYAKTQWSDPELNLTNKSIANIPYTYFWVLALPERYWNSSAKSEMHGDCYR
jgi:hypothetical protein